jgi:hypothetical protein
MNAQTEMTEAQRQFDNKLLRLIQQHFPSIPLHGEEADKNWTRWLNFARDCAHLTKPDAGGGEVKPMVRYLNGMPYTTTYNYGTHTETLMDDCSMAVNYTPPSDVPAEPVFKAAFGLYGHDGHLVATPSPVPAEPPPGTLWGDSDIGPDVPVIKESLTTEPSVVPMPPVLEETALGICHQYTLDQLKAYADARVAEATRELVEVAGVRVEFAKTAPGRLPSHVQEPIAKYTQAQKESK